MPFYCHAQVTTTPDRDQSRQLPNVAREKFHPVSTASTILPFSGGRRPSSMKWASRASASGKRAYPCFQIAVVYHFGEFCQVLGLTLTRKKVASTHGSLRVPDLGWIRPKPACRRGAGPGRAGLRFATDEIKDGVHVPGRVLETLCPKINHRVRPELSHIGEIVRAGRRDGSDASAAGKLHRISANIPCGSMNQDRLACRELRVIEQALPSRHGDNGNGRPLQCAERGRLPCDHCGGSQSVFGVGADKARIRDAIDLIADAHPGNVWPESLDFTGQVGTQREGERLRKRASSASDPTVPWTDPGGMDLDQDFAVAGHWHRNALEPHCLRGPNSCTRQAIIDVPTWWRASSMEMLPVVIGQSFVSVAS